MSGMLRDVRFGVQTLLRAPGFTFVAVVTLALGVGANSAIFSVASGTMLYALPWEDPGTIVSLYDRFSESPDDERGISPGRFRDYLEQARSFSGLSAAAGWGLNLTDGDQLDFVEAARVTPNAFQLLGIRPLLGRGLIPEDGHAGAERVAVITEELWKARYGADPEIVGRSIEIDGEPVTVVGVQGAAQWFPWPWTRILVPLRLDEIGDSRTERWFGAIGRLAPGVSIEAAQTEVDLISARLAEQYPESDRDWRGRLGFTRDQIVRGQGRTGIWIMLGAVGVVLLIACANVANLLLARATARQKEIAVRAALGASRRQIVLQLLTEGLVLAALSLPFALLVTRWAIDFLLAQVPPNVTYMDRFFRFDGPVWTYCALVTFGTVLLFGLVPALHASRVDLQTALKESGDRGSSDSGRRRLRSALVVAEIGFALALLVSAGLLIQSFLNYQDVDPGFDIDRLVVTTLALPENRYPEEDQRRAFQAELLREVRRLPRVARAATANFPPFGFGGGDRDFEVRGRPEAGRTEMPRASYVNMSPDYLDLLGVPVLRGRPLAPQDDAAAARVSLVNETLERRFFPEDGALGERLTFQADEGRERAEHEIVGVVQDMKNWNLGEPAYPRIYAPYAQSPWAYMGLIVRTEGDEHDVTRGIREVVSGIDPMLPLFAFETMTERVDRSKWQIRMLPIVMSTLGALALVLATVGVYGVVSYASAQRTREFGIRSALGASPGGIAGLVLREAGVLAAYGVALGLVLSAGMGRVLQSLLFEMSPWSPQTFVSVALLIAAVALVASAVPARRATRVDPMIALRAE